MKTWISTVGCQVSFQSPLRLATSFFLLTPFRRSSGPPFDYWSQYENISMNLVEISGASVLIGFGISWVFLAGKLFSDRRHGALKVIAGSLVGAMLIAATCFFCLVAVIGISILSGVSMTAFSIMSFVLSVGFAVEYSVHIVARWLRSDKDSAIDRVEQTMSFLMLPTFMSFVSSTVGVICLAFTDFDFNTRFFFRPLITVMFVTYFFGCYWLPVFLTWFEFDFVKLGPSPTEVVSEKVKRCGSPLCKLQESESSEPEDSTEDFINSRSSDTEANVVSMANCIPKGGSDNDGLEFLPCYAMTSCGAEGSFEGAESDAKSLPTMPANAARQPETVGTSFSAESSSLASTAQRSLFSVASSQKTIPVNNTRTAMQRQRGGGDPTPGMPYDRKEGNSLVGNLSTESHDVASTVDLLAVVSSESSNVFDGVDTTASRDIADQPLVTSQQSRGPLRKGSPGPLTISPLHAMPKEATEGPRSTGSIAQPSVASSEFFNDSYPPVRQTLSSPRKSSFSLSPLGGFKPAANEDSGPFPSTDPKDTSRDFLLSNADFVGLDQGSYDFGDVTEESVPPSALDHGESPRSNREIVTAESGEALSVPSSDSSSQDTSPTKM